MNSIKIFYRKKPLTGDEWHAAKASLLAELMFL
jgi:hypothetical protein